MENIRRCFIKIMIKNKKKLILSLIFFIILISLTIYVNKFNANGWTYLKYNNILYVLNIDTPIAYEETKELNKVSVIKKNTLPFLKPNRNNTSNGIPKGIEIYSSSQNDDIYILSNKKFYKLDNISTSDDWGNGIKTKFDSLY